jgi:hypothetical protein
VRLVRPQFTHRGQGEFPHFPQCIRIHNQYTHRRIVPFMLLCIVSAASKFPRPALQDASLFRFCSPLFIESLGNCVTTFVSCACELFVRSFTQERKSTGLFSCVCELFTRSFLQERKSTLLFSCACTRFCRNGGEYLRSPKKALCYHQLANTQITIGENLCDGASSLCVKSRWLTI